MPPKIVVYLCQRDVQMLIEMPLTSRVYNAYDQFMYDAGKRFKRGYGNAD
jgi:hypothetical protein